MTFMWSKLKSFFIKYILDICLILALCIACISYARTFDNSRRVDEIFAQVSSVQKDVISLQKQVIELNRDIIDRLDAIQVHLELLDKYAAAEYYHFYGDVKNSKFTDNSKQSSKTIRK